MATSDEFVIKQHDTRPSILGTLSADPTDIFSDVLFLMKDQSGNLTVNFAGTIVEQPSSSSGGKVKYQWQTGDTATPGVYRAEFQVTFNDGRIETYPNGSYLTINIYEDLGP